MIHRKLQFLTVITSPHCTLFFFFIRTLFIKTSSFKLAKIRTPSKKNLKNIWSQNHDEFKNIEAGQKVFLYKKKSVCQHFLNLHCIGVLHQKMVHKIIRKNISTFIWPFFRRRPMKKSNTMNRRFRRRRAWDERRSSEGQAKKSGKQYRVELETELSRV